METPPPRSSQDSGQETKATYDALEQAWVDLRNATARIQQCAHELKRGPRSIDGYQVERALRKHKPDLIPIHQRNLAAHRQKHGV